jgi:hypothetical protein
MPAFASADFAAGKAMSLVASSGPAKRLSFIPVLA